MKRFVLFHRAFVISTLMLCGLPQLQAQTIVGQWALDPSMPTRNNDCQQYQWPESRSACPEVLIKQKHDHTPSDYYRSQGWDTAVSCANPQIVLSCSPYVPVQYFNGFYTVDQIPYNPPDPSFSLGTRMPITTDDDFAASSTRLDFPFFFFGLKKTQFRLGANGLVTFCSDADFGSGTRCPFPLTSASTLPWTRDTTLGPNGEVNVSTRTPEGLSYFARMHDAIYGVFEDTHPLARNVTYPQGIYYGVIDSFPCRKIIASWNQIPLYREQVNNRQTYQIVCYEGSNIIEVHIKRRGVNPDWNAGLGLIGIQNATGQPQRRSLTPGSPTMQVKDGSLPAYYPQGGNLVDSELHEVAYRFTPCGSTMMRSEWYQIFPDGRDSVPLSTTVGDPKGYYIGIDQDTSICHNLSLAYVSPDSTSTYVFHLKFQNANKDWYNLYDTITVGVDTLRDWAFSCRQASVCAGTPFLDTLLTRKRVQLEEDNLSWSAYCLRGKDSIDVSHLITPYPWMENNNNKLLKISINTTDIPNPRPNTVDTLRIISSVTFPSGCRNFDVLTLYVYPNFDLTQHHAICRGDTFTWQLSDHYDNCHFVQQFTQPTDSNLTFVTLHSLPGCDSTVRLALIVADTNRSVDTVDACQPYTWLNGRTYYESNHATTHLDTVVLANRYGCDSTVRLLFTLHPLSARLTADLESFDLDHLDVTLTDISTGGDSRTWLFPSGETQHNPVAYYSIPPTLDQAEIWLVEYSPFGCADSTSVVIPLNKEHFWLPNAFTPDHPEGNNLFGPTSTHTLHQEMSIYNRAGTLVFHCSGVDCKWNGRDPDGNPCPQGSYVYSIRYSTIHHPDQTLLKQGTVTLIR